MKRGIIPCIAAMAVLGTFFIVGCCRTASENASEAVSASHETYRQTAVSARPDAKNPEGKGRAYYEFFDTVSFIYSFAGDSDEVFDGNAKKVSELLYEYHKLFDIYYEYTGVNNLRTVNLNAGGPPIKVDGKLVDFLLYARELNDLTAGEMDIMMGSVLSIWHDARSAETPYVPGPEMLEEASRHIGFRFLEIDEENSTVRITDPRASIDVGALGKGYATEMAARLLEDMGVSHYVLNIGGNLRIIGAKVDGSGWITGIRDPRNPDSDFAIRIEVSDCSCVTSGTYERYFTVDGVRYPHIIDKDTLHPARYFESLSVVTRDSGLADALSTALFCMDYENGLAMVSALEGVDCIWIFPDGDIRYTPGIDALVR